MRPIVIKDREDIYRVRCTTTGVEVEPLHGEVFSLVSFMDTHDIRDARKFSFWKDLICDRTLDANPGFRSLILDLIHGDIVPDPDFPFWFHIRASGSRGFVTGPVDAYMLKWNPVLEVSFEDFSLKPLYASTNRDRQQVRALDCEPRIKMMPVFSRHDVHDLVLIEAGVYDPINNTMGHVGSYSPDHDGDALARFFNDLELYTHLAQKNYPFDYKSTSGFTDFSVHYWPLVGHNPDPKNPDVVFYPRTPGIPEKG